MLCIVRNWVCMALWNNFIKALVHKAWTSYHVSQELPWVSHVPTMFAKFEDGS